MAKMLTRSWWALALSGVAAILFGVLAFRWPGLALLGLVTLYGAFALVDGLFSIIAAIEGIVQHETWVWLLARGIAGVAAGIITFDWPGITALALLYIIALWAIVIGGIEIGTAIQLRREMPNEWLLIIQGALAVIFGLALIIFPGGGALALIWLIATFAIIAGVLRISLAFRLRSLQHEMAEVAPRARVRA